MKEYYYLEKGKGVKLVMVTEQNDDKCVLMDAKYKSDVDYVDKSNWTVGDSKRLKPVNVDDYILYIISQINASVSAIERYNFLIDEQRKALNVANNSKIKSAGLILDIKSNLTKLTKELIIYQESYDNYCDLYFKFN